MRGANQCQHCYLFCKYEGMDSYTPYGGIGNDQCEPHDPVQICKKCSEQLKQEFIQKFKNGYYLYGDWHKSRAEREAAKECGLVWIDNDGRLEFNGRKLFCEYIPKDIYDELCK